MVEELALLKIVEFSTKRGGGFGSADFPLGDALKKTDLRTLSQKVGGGQDQIPKFVVCEIGT